MEKPNKYLFLTKEEAAAHCKKAPKNTSFHLHVRVDMPLMNKPSQEYRGGFTGYLTISRAQAIRMFTSGHVAKQVADEALIPVTECHATQLYHKRGTTQMHDVGVTKIWIG